MLRKGAISLGQAAKSFNENVSMADQHAWTPVCRARQVGARGADTHAAFLGVVVAPQART
jgi:hypothetical protein